MDPLAAAYMLSGLLCIAFYIPQIWDLLTRPESRAGINPITWAAFINASLMGVIYAFFRTEDVFFQIIVTGYGIGNVAVYACALLPHGWALKIDTARLRVVGQAALYLIFGRNFRTYP